MKKIFYILCFLQLAFTMISCNDDFLLKNNRILYDLSDTLFLNNYEETIETSVQLPKQINSDFSIFMQPKWLSFNELHGKVIAGKVPLKISVTTYLLPAGGYQTHYGTFVLDVKDFGLIYVNVAFPNYGSPFIQCSSYSIYFGTADFFPLTISNTNQGILKWRINSFPNWLIVSPVSGSLENGNSTTVNISLDYDNINQQQELIGSILLTNNTINDSIDIPVHVSANAIMPADIKQISGVVTDSEFNTETGTMVICTKMPNSLIIFNTLNNESQTIPLSKTPNCISISEDGLKAVIGYSVSSVSYIDLVNLNIIGEYTVDCIPYDIVLGGNEWSYITPTDNQHEQLRSLNLRTGILYTGKYATQLYEKTIIKKIHGKPFMVGTRTSVSPNGILIFDVRKGVASDTISYYHTSTGNIWISEDGTKLFTGIKYVYNLPEYDLLFHSNSPTLFGRVETNMHGITSFAECPSKGYIFISSTYLDNSLGSPAMIEQYSLSNLNKINSIKISPVVISENGIKKIYETSPRFIFANKEGSGLYILKTLKGVYNKDYWTIESAGIRK
jgi:hypothetical protein